MRLTRKEKDQVEELLWDKQNNGHLEFKRFLMDNFEYYQILQILGFIKDMCKVFKNTTKKGGVGKADTLYNLEYTRYIDKLYTGYKIQAIIENFSCGIEKKPYIKIDIYEGVHIKYSMKNNFDGGLYIDELNQLINLIKYILEKWGTGGFS